MNKPNNPYSPPLASVDDASTAEAGLYIAGGRVAPAGNGSKWLGTAWGMFKQSPGTWIGMFLIFMVIWMLICLLPIVSMFSMIAFPLFMGGFMIACDNQRKTGSLNLGDLFAGFQQKGGPLALLGLLNMALMFVIFLPFIVIGIIGGVAAGAAGAFSGPNTFLMFTLIGLGIAIMAIAICLGYAAIYYAPALVALNDVPPIDAMKSSFKACMRNWRAGLIYFILILLLGILACIPLGLGLLVLTPVIYASIYTSYRDIFILE